MSYALEAKKRKFERILESLVDSSSPQTEASSKIQINDSTTSNLTDVASTKRRRITPVGSLRVPSQVSSTSLTTHYLPSSRLAFLERLESYRQVTKWHIPSTSVINAVEWTKRGWICQDTDTVSCPSCKERLHVDVEINTREPEDIEHLEAVQAVEDDDPLIVADGIIETLMRRYQDMIVTSHISVCPWRRRGCDSSIQRIEGLLNAPTAILGLEHRYYSIMEADTEVPPVITLPSSPLCDVDESELKVLKFDEHNTVKNLDALRLAICGWQKKEMDIIECRHCFRSLGLWLYRGALPTVEHLDAVDSHLEYCPWRSEIAQDTQLAATDGKPAAFPGWLLVYLAIVRRNHRGKTPLLPVVSQHQDVSQTETALHDSPEQRERKMKDLMKRIRDLKKPFNVKSLLKRKDKSQS